MPHNIFIRKNKRRQVPWWSCGGAGRRSATTTWSIKTTRPFFFLSFFTPAIAMRYAEMPKHRSSSSRSLLRATMLSSDAIEPKMADDATVPRNVALTRPRQWPLIAPLPVSEGQVQRRLLFRPQANSKRESRAKQKERPESTPLDD